MSKDELPDIPSWEELGLTPEEIAELEKELGGDLGVDDDGPAVAAPDPKTRRDSSQKGTSAPKPAGPKLAAHKPSANKPSDKAPPASAGSSPTEPKAAPKKPKRSWFSRKKKSKSTSDAAPDTAQGKAAPKAASGGAGSLGGLPPTAKDAGSLPSSYRGLVAAALMILMGWLSSSHTAVPGPVPATAPDSVFSSERAFAHFDQISRAAHPPGSPEHDRVREYLLGELRDLGFSPEVQTTTEAREYGSFTRAVTVRNIVARKPGSESTGAVLITAHYDGREVSLAAGDAGTGVVAILESLRALGSAPLRNDLIVLFTDAEELGLVGAHAFVNQHHWFDDVRFALSFEMRGAGGATTMFETGREGGWAVAEFAGAAPVVMANSLAYEVYERMPNDTDFTPIKEAGVQGLNFAAIGRAHIYHQEYDNPENLDPGTVQQHGNNALATLRHFGSADLTQVDGPERVYFSVPFQGIVTYPRWVSWALSGGLALLLVGLLVFARRFGVAGKGVAAGAVGALVVMVGSGAAGYGLIRWVRGFHAEAGALHGSLFHVEWPYLFALVAIALALATAMLGILKRWFTLAEVALGALIIPVLAAVAAGFLVPLGAMNLQWPALAGLVGAALVFGVDRDAPLGWGRWLALVVLAAPVLVFVVPVTELLWLALTIGMAPLIAAWLALSLMMALPQVALLREPKAWGTTVAVAILGVGFVAVGLALSGPSDSRPQPNTLLYAFDRSTGEAVWATDASASDSTVGELGQVAAAWATERVGSPDSVRTLRAFTGSRVQYATAATSPLQAPAPAVAVDTDSVSGRVRVSIQSRLGAENVLFMAGENGPRPTAINGHALTQSTEVASYDHWGRPEGSITLDFAGSAQPFRLVMVENLLRPEEVVGPGVFDRPAELAPNLRTRSDRVMVRSVLEIDPVAGSVRIEGPGTGQVSAPSDTADAGADPSAPTTATADAPTPVDVAVSLFGRGAVSSVDPEFAISFAPDGRTAYFNRTDAAREQFSLLATILNGQQWSDPEPVPFALPGALDVDPFVTPDGNRIYFSSDRPREGAPAGSMSTWYVERTPTGWGPPVAPGAPFNSDSTEVFVSAARDGTVVFRSERLGGRRVFLTREVDGVWQEPTPLLFGNVSAASNPLIEPDGRFVVLAMPGPVGSQDLWVSCRNADGSWSDPVVLPEPINSPYADFAPAFNPADGSLLFTSERPGILGPVPDSERPASDIWQVDPSYQIDVCSG